MRSQLTGGDLAGTLPILYVYIARSGKTIREVSLVNLDKDGTCILPRVKRAACTPGVKIVLAERQRPGADGLLFPHRRLELRRAGLRLS